MLRVKELTRVLQEAHRDEDEMNNIILLTDDGSVLAASRDEEGLVYSGAVISSIFNEYKVNLKNFFT